MDTLQKNKAIWLVGGGHLQVPAIREIKRQGFFVIVSDADDHCPAIHEDICFVKASTYDVTATAKMIPAVLNRYNIVGAMTCGADVAPTVAMVAEVTANRGLDLETALLTHNKYHVRHELDKRGMGEFQPQWKHYSLQEYKSHTDPIGVMIQNMQAEYERWQLGPLAVGAGIVIKPLSKSGSRGVTIVPQPGVAHTAWLRECIKKVFAFGREFLVEERFMGTEHSVELLINDENIVIYSNVVDRPFDYTGGIAMEQGHVNPTNLPDYTKNEMTGMVVKAAHALGVRWGPFKCDTIMTKDGPRILEATARLSGGFDCQYTTPIATGRNPIGALVKLVTGQHADSEFLAPKQERFAACVASFPPEGYVEAIQDSLFAEPSIDEIRAGKTWSLITCKVGDTINYQHCADRAAFSIACALTHEAAWDKAVAAAGTTGQRIFIRD